MLQGHGDDAYCYKQEIIADFSTNVFYGGEPAGLKEHIFQQWQVLNKYPEVLAESLAQKISQHHQLHASNVLITNGTTESIYLIAQAYKNLQTTIAIPAFAEYEDACRMHHHQVQFVNQDAIHPNMQMDKGLFFLCNPNNPTGHVFPQLEALIKAHPETLFVIDEAFIEFTVGINSLISLINTCENVIVLRSLTKAYAIPGLRLGYIAAHARLIDTLLQCKMPWSVNAFAIAAGHYIFDHISGMQLPLERIFNDKEQLMQQLRQLSFTIDNSYTHYFLAKTPVGTARELKAYLIDHHRLLIRDASNFRGLTEQHFRIATLTKDKNELLIAALQEWIKHCS
ncbi:pyridoxal phosphate-dependent class II aminotransferase [Niastella caeni]|uniref:Aminotransferase n=1 Tax=Niastella caeni TaxID=2569763 RepID=A0A4S8HRP1_9BACT|nr:aminotransferase class I/II-fold pyridoxal phosphate-dependent enzyme [Niastella caeni]THU38113.1 pyridoxal phosphate-dependent class II aminotransferase [Niastella caeni]